MQAPIFNSSDADLTAEQVQTLLSDSERPRKRRTMPPRRTKTLAADKIRSIHEWENCSENSAMFRQAAARLDMELQHISAEEAEAMDDTEHVLDSPCSIIHSEHSNHESESDLSFVEKDSLCGEDEDWEPDTDPCTSTSPEPEDEVSEASSQPSETSTPEHINASPSTANTNIEDAIGFFLQDPGPPNLEASYSFDLEPTLADPHE